MAANWRSSLRKSVSRLAKSLSLGWKEESLVQERGLSLAKLRLICSDLAHGAGDDGAVELLVLQKRTTVQWVEECANGKVKVKVATSEGFVEKVVAKDSLEKKPRKLWTVEDVCRYFVLPALEECSFYVDVVEEEHVGRPYQGVFVSHPHSTPFAELVEALEVKFEAQDHENVFVWLDLFCSNQMCLMQMDDRTLKKRKAELLGKLLPKLVERFDMVLFYFNAFEGPTFLKRAWCIWEMYCAARCGRECDVVFSPQVATADATKELLKVYGQVMPHAFEDQRDKELIEQLANEQDGGIDRVWQAVAEKITEWMVKVVAAKVEMEDLARGGKDSEEFATLLTRAGLMMAVLKEREKSSRYHSKAEDMLHSLFGTRKVAAIYASFAEEYNHKGRYPEAVTLCSKSLKFTRAYYGEYDVNTIQAYNCLGIALRDAGEYDEAMQTFENILILINIVFKESHHSIGGVMTNIGTVHFAQKEYESALSAYTTALDIFAGKLGDRHVRVAEAFGNMGRVYMELKKNQKALDTFRKALDIYNEKLGDEHHSVAAILDCIGMVYLSDNKINEALEEFSKVVRIYVNSRRKKSFDAAAAYRHMGQAYLKLGKFSEAEISLESALRIFEETVGERHLQTAETYEELATALEGKKMQFEAAELLEKALWILEDLGFPRHHERLAHVRFRVRIHRLREKF